MKKLMKLIVVVAIALTPFLVGSSASAQQATCAIGFTGPNSENLCVSTTTYNCSVTNENEISVVNESGQVVATGTATTSGNGSGGNATSGSATNDNGTNFAVSITNERVCTAVVTVPPTVTPEQPVVPTTSVGNGNAGGGGGAGQVAVLPETSSDTTLTTTAWIASALLLVAGLSAGGALWYRHTKA